MKKLMIAAALATFCGAVQTFGLSSQNVVGYATPTLGDNANLAGCPFDMVGAAGMDIQNIKPASDGMYGGGVTMKLLNSDLSDLVEYYYVPADEAPDGVTAGWYEDDFATLAVKTFGAGEGFILMNNLSDCTAMYSGEVMVGKPTWEVAPNANLAGNITPISLDIQDIKVNAAVDTEGNLCDPNDELYGGAFTLKLLSSDLSDLAEYYYVPAAEAPDGLTAGWYEDDFATLAVKTFSSGEGFIVMCNLPAGFVQIPAALTAE